MPFYRTGMKAGADFNYDACFIECEGVKYLPYRSLFAYNADFNSPVNIGEMATYCPLMFVDDTNYNQPTRIPNNVTNLWGMFQGCTSFNQPVVIGENVHNAGQCFWKCENYNQPVTLGNNVVSCISMFSNCYKYNQPITIPKSVINVTGMFRNATAFGSDVYIKGNEYRNIDICNMFYGITSSSAKRKNVWFNSVLNNVFNRNDANSFRGGSITWSAMTNGFFNASYNIYCYNNYEG